ncbi:MAG: hypothetical protein FWE87_04605 [Coriobacteriia bacterium]|nr:hypothetical protein [Coriobacteriia bacterium]
MPDRDIPLQPEEPRPIPREEALDNEQTAWIDPTDPDDEVIGGRRTYERPTYQRPTNQQPTYTTYSIPGRRGSLRGCQLVLIAMLLLFLLSCCACNSMTNLFTPATTGSGLYDYGYDLGY